MFFVSLGVLADVRAITWELMSFVLGITLVAIVTMLVGCGLPASMSWRDSTVLGFGMVPRGEVALLALNQGFIEQPAYVALVLMARLTTIVTPLVLCNFLLK